MTPDWFYVVVIAGVALAVLGGLYVADVGHVREWVLTAGIVLGVLAIGGGLLGLCLGAIWVLVRVVRLGWGSP